MPKKINRCYILEFCIGVQAFYKFKIKHEYCLKQVERQISKFYKIKKIAKHAFWEFNFFQYLMCT